MADSISQDETVPGESSVASNGDSKAYLDRLVAQATAKYSIKNYSTAAEFYSRATELQAEINGEMSPRNADLLYAYGRCLYHVAVSNSDVLGTRVAGEREDGSSKKSRRKKVNGEDGASGPTAGKNKLAEDVIEKVVEEKNGVKETEEDLKLENKPYFQFTGDENFDDSEEEDNEAELGEDDAATAVDEDDFSNAYEVLDLARILLQRRLEEVNTERLGKSVGDSGARRHLRELLADAHDLQAEISLEGERFPDAVLDLNAALELKKELFPQDSSLIAEAHYKLSLALEFASVTQQKDEKGEIEAGTHPHIDEAMRDEAANEMEAAIASCKQRIQKEEKTLASELSTNSQPLKVVVTRGSIDDVIEMVKDMEQRV